MRNLLIKILIRMINIIQSSNSTVVNSNSVSGHKIYNEVNDTSIIIQFFNKRSNISEINNRIKSSKAKEIIVNEDGSSDGSLQVWANYLTGKNHFVIRSNDLFEVITYDRAIDFSRGKYISLLQDDDLPPDGPRWIEQAEYLFDKFEDLAIIGGRSGLDLLPIDNSQVESGGYRRAGNVAEVPGLFRYRMHERPSLSCDGIPFEFVEAVNRAPMFVRKSALKALGGIDQSFAPFQCDDVDICLRAWLSGYKVGLYDSNFARNLGVGGMRIYNKNAKHVPDNWRKIYNRYGEQISSGMFRNIVSESNASLRT